VLPSIADVKKIRQNTKKSSEITDVNDLDVLAREEE
jgi:hypothetical protein